MAYTLLGIQFKTVKPLKKAMKVVLKISKENLISVYCLNQLKFRYQRKFIAALFIEIHQYLKIIYMSSKR